MSNKARLKPVVLRYLDELYGNSAASIYVCAAYDENLKTLTNSSNHQVYKSAPLSTDRIKKEFNLKDSNKSFIAFRDYVDKEMKIAITSIYASFAKFTAPIFSAEMISSMANRFKIDLYKHHLLIECLLNKHKYSNLSKTKDHSKYKSDRYVFYTFMLLMRVRNPQKCMW